MFVEVAVNLPSIRGTFHYHLPPELHAAVQPGHLVTVTFGPRRVQGLILQHLETTDVPETKPILGLVDTQPVLTPQQLKLARWLQEQTLAPLMDCATLMLPPGLSQQADMLFSLVEAQAEGKGFLEKRLIDLLRSRGALRGRQIARALPRLEWRRAADALARRGILSTSSVLEAPRLMPKRIPTARIAGDTGIVRAALDRLGDSPKLSSKRRHAMLELLLREGASLEASWIYAETGGNHADLRYLEKHGLVALGETEVWRDPLEEIDFVPSEPPALTIDQAAVWDRISQAFQLAGGDKPTPFLLHGVTGSGKTEIYLRAVAEALRSGKQAIVLVPEIALTPQTVRRFLARFPGRVGLLHSRLSAGERYDTWRRCRSGELGVVVGARSALFSPLPNIGLIAVDEAHDESYKEQEQAPRYHARETALAYADILGAVCILGSATPDVVTAFRAAKGSLVSLQLPKRILGHRQRLEGQASRLGITPHYAPAGPQADAIELPPVRVVDMRQELRAGNRSLFSRALQQALRETLGAGEQAILFLNRRGTSTYIFCRDCGYVLRCSRCDTPLTHHATEARLICHHCGYRRGLPSRCPACRGAHIRHFGAGTERIEAEIQRLLPQVRPLRWDWDTTRTRGAHDVILAHFAAHRADVLIGTQMIAKGLDLPLVTLVGVVSADTGLNLPDYRAAERTFQVLAQVAGRAGRGLLGGRVILQTYQPEHYVIRAAADHDFQAFYEQELSFRRELRYPPFVRLARLVYRHVSPDRAQAEAERLAQRLRAERVDGKPPDLIGPVPCFFRRIRGEYRWQIILRSQTPADWIPAPLPPGWGLDIDPVSLL